MAELYRRKESRFWWMAFVINHRTYRFSTRKENRHEAKQAMDEHVAKFLKGLNGAYRNSRKLTTRRPISGDVPEAVPSHNQYPALSQG